MRRQATLVAVLAGFVLVAAPSTALGRGGGLLATRCSIFTTSNPGGGFATFTGNCNGRGVLLSASTASVIGSVGGLRVSLIGGDVFMSGYIGSWRTTYSVLGQTVTGYYGRYRMFFTSLGNSLVGRVGTARDMHRTRYKHLHVIHL
jgi:hypothetical protein